MIECTEKNIWYIKRRRFRKKRRFIVFIFIIITVVSFIYYHTLVCKELFEFCTDYAYTFSTEAVNQAVLASVADNVNYNDLITVDKNSEGDITLISINSLKVNTLNREIAVATSDVLKNKLKDGIPVPWLTFTGISVLSGYGKTVSFKTMNVSNVKCDFSSNFKSVGLNQTLHSIYIDVICEVNIEVPFNSKKSQCKTSVLIGETVLVGKIPDTYLNGKLFN